MTLPSCQTLELERSGAVLRLWLARPEARNALSGQLLDELEQVLDALAGERGIRVVVLRGRGGNFCAGADLKDVAGAFALPVEHGHADPLAHWNRRLGRVLSRLEGAPQVIVAAVEGAVVGGGLGLVCAADLAIAREGVSFRLAEVTLGLVPAQISPFLVRRLGVSQARRLALTAARVEAREAQRLGLVHEHCEGEAALEAAVNRAVREVLHGAPEALAATKRLLLRAAHGDDEALLDDGAAAFAKAARGPEGREGVQAVLEKRRPGWAPEEP